MQWSPIGKPASARRSANLTDYERARREFDWDRAATALSGLPGGGLNIAHEAVDRHAAGPRADHTALRWVDHSERVVELSYAELARRTSRFAALLRDLGLRKGDRVFTLLGRVPELYVAVLGALKAGCVVCPLFSAFGPEPIRQRLRLGEAAALVTSPGLYRGKVSGIRDEVPSLRHVLVTGADAGPSGDVLALEPALAAAGEDTGVAATSPDDPALLHFTSGTTGTPKGALHVHGAVLAHHVTAEYALDLRADDVFWCTADPGWVTGMSYGIIAPLTHGATLVSDEAEFDARRWYRVLAQQRVNVWYTAPTALRMLMRYGPELARSFDLSALRFVASVGEPLNPEVVLWGQEQFGLPVHDNWWQTETGAIMISNFAAVEVRPGSMGLPLPGIEACVLARDRDGKVLRVDGRVREVSDPATPGELALRAGWPSMFRAYWGEQRRYADCFADGWYLTGDIARRDADGYYWFLGRADDVIKSAGHLVGPFEVESTLLEHPSVAEAGVIGKPDDVAGELVKAFVTLRPGVTASEPLRRELLAFGRRRLGAVAPREIEFDQHLPHTRSGKVMRRLLRARELGLAEGDLSTLEAAR
ncbi:acyl-CoA synthetase/AMP-acid ligase [Saccharomonospora marina XMU15]|uniref:acetate--CoA ligase n=1 Tax=Saccharomonospora marina XMU15 TaxID=882083 RepID=H5X0S3_9PSEU|nr:acetate--CoA ligase [Saccharomonospora marina]EHR50869.1 acyl-CoA synthetase/AMP-acid ligase [Saccharomonospora marina XMU15]